MASFSHYRIIKDKIAEGSMLSITLASILLVIFIGAGLYIKSGLSLSKKVFSN
jgi:hypothetical protein